MKKLWKKIKWENKVLIIIFGSVFILFIIFFGLMWEYTHIWLAINFDTHIAGKEYFDYEGNKYKCAIFHKHGFEGEDEPVYFLGEKNYIGYCAVGLYSCLTETYFSKDDYEKKYMFVLGQTNYIYIIYTQEGYEFPYMYNDEFDSIAFISDKGESDRFEILPEDIKKIELTSDERWELWSYEITDKVSATFANGDFGYFDFSICFKDGKIYLKGEEIYIVDEKYNDEIIEILKQYDKKIFR